MLLIQRLSQSLAILCLLLLYSELTLDDLVCDDEVIEPLVVCYEDLVDASGKAVNSC